MTSAPSLKLIYHTGSHQNFGDALNEVLWPQLAPTLFNSSSRIGFLGIGTLIGRRIEDIDHLHVFSSGMGYDGVSEWTMPRTIWCVRGPLSARMLEVDPALALTDGAILAPEVLGVSPGSVERKGVGLVPHWQSELEGGWPEAAAAAGMELISPINEPAAVFHAINRKSLIITESLHGAIVADALGVPWIAIATSGNVAIFKWTDWSQSVGVKLRLFSVPAPGGTAIARYGRFRPGTGTAPMMPTCEDAIGHFRGPPPGKATAFSTWSSAAKKSLLEHPLSARLLGFSPAAMAERLASVATQEPQLSEASVRTRLLERMRERFDALVKQHTEPQRLTAIGGHSFKTPGRTRKSRVRAVG